MVVMMGEGGVQGNAVGFAAQISFSPPDQYISASKLLTVVARGRFPSEPFAFSLSVFVLRSILCPPPPTPPLERSMATAPCLLDLHEPTSSSAK